MKRILRLGALWRSCRLEKRSVNNGKDAKQEITAAILPRSSEINVMLAGAIALACSFAFYVLLHISSLRSSYIGELCCDRGLIQYATILFFFWGISILVLKVRYLRREAPAFDFELLQIGENILIRQSDARQYIRKIRMLPVAQRERLLTNRVWRALVQFKLLGSAQKVGDLLRYQGEIDSEHAESSYGFLRFIIALVPILGFLGTVLGISAAVAGFSGVLATAGEVSSIKSALKEVTSGLATAFDTTLLALAMSAVLMLGQTVTQGTEESLLARIENYCMDNLLDRLWTPTPQDQFEAALSRALLQLPDRLAAAIDKQSRHNES